MRDFQAHADLERRANAARRTGCDESSDRATSEGIVIGVILAGPLWALAIVGGYFLIQWLKGFSWTT